MNTRRCWPTIAMPGGTSSGQVHMPVFARLNRTHECAHPFVAPGPATAALHGFLKVDPRLGARVANAKANDEVDVVVQMYRHDTGAETRALAESGLDDLRRQGHGLRRKLMPVCLALRPSAFIRGTRGTADIGCRIRALRPWCRHADSRARRTAAALLLLRRQVLIHGHVRVALPRRTERPSWKDADFAVAEAAIQLLGVLAATRVQYEQGAAMLPGSIMQGSDQRSADTLATQGTVDEHLVHFRPMRRI